MISVLQIFYVGRSEGGGERHARLLEQAMTARGHTVTNVCFIRSDGTSPDGWHTLTPERYWSSRTRFVRHPLEALRLIRSTRPDLILCHTPTAAMLVLPLARFLGVRGRVNIHHVPLKRFASQSRAIVWAERLIGSSSVYSQIVMVAEIGLQSVEDFPRRYRKKTRLILNEVPPIQSTDRRAARTHFSLHDDETAYLFVGRRTIAKGAHVAASAAALGQLGPLLMAGDPGDADGAIEEAMAKGADIRRLGPLDREELGVLYQASDALVFPSRFETRPLTLLEAHSVGLPIAARDLPENRAVLNDVPIYVANEDPLEWVAAMKAAKSRGRVSPPGHDPQSFDAMVDAYLELADG